MFCASLSNCFLDGIGLGLRELPATGFLAVSPEEQFAEKLHAYTLPRVGRENTRVKDLVDLVLLIERTKLDTIAA